ncbi:MAG: lysophospholipid acyltransferase family protein [Acidobacteriota bacterium]
MPPEQAADDPNTDRKKLSQRLWRSFCRLQVRIFYHRFEADGLEQLAAEGPVILAANHVNALADAVVVQAAIPRPIRPIARSGLFRNPLLVPILSVVQAVPIYRRPAEQAGEKAAGSNDESFAKLYELLAEGQVILIFPEGQSHSDPSLRPLKTGAARLALGHLERTGQRVSVVPVGLVFTRKGRFRTGCLVKVGEPVEFQEAAGESPEEAVRRYTDSILEGLQAVTLNAESWQDVALLQHLQHFFALRSRRGDRPSLSQRFRSLQRLIEDHRRLRSRWPGQVESLREKLERFQSLCRRHGVRDYQLSLRYTPKLVTAFLARHLSILLLVAPIALWGLLNSAIPYGLTRAAAALTAKGRDQYDSARMLFGCLFFGLFWSAQTAFVAWRFAPWPWAAAYALSLPLTSGLAFVLVQHRDRILEEARVFLLFMRRRELRVYLADKRSELEVELAAMARLARRVHERDGVES